MKQLNEHCKYDFLFAPILKESVADEKDPGQSRMRVRGKIQQIGGVNENKRSYPKCVWDKVFNESSPFMQKLKNRQVLGILEHPEKGGTKLSDVSHLVEKVWVEGSDIMGDILILNTPPGNILKELFDVGVRVGISSRANGDIRKLKDGVEEVLPENFDLDTWDFVYRPSVSDALPTPVLEGINGKIKTVEDKMQLKESLTVMRDAEDLVKKVQESKGDSSATSLLETCHNLERALNSLESVEDSCKDEANVLKGRILSVLPKAKSELDRVVKESSNDVKSQEVIKQLLAKNKNLTEEVKTLTEKNIQLSDSIKMFESKVGELTESTQKTVKELTEAVSVKEAKIVELETSVKTVNESMAALKTKSISVVEGLLDTKDRAVTVVEGLLDTKDRAIDVVEGLLDTKDRAVTVVEGLLDTKDRSVAIVEALLNKIDEKEAKINSLVGLMKSIVERARILQRNTYLAKAFKSNPALKEHKSKFAQCSTVVECENLIKKLGVSLKESKIVVGHDGNIASRKPSYIPVEGSKAKTITESKPSTPKGFVSLLAKKTRK